MIKKIYHTKSMNDIDGFVLAGGVSSRMGQAKANLLLGGKTFARRAASALSAVAQERISVVGNMKESAPDLPILPDEFVGGKGEQKRAALVGLHAALSNTRANWAAVVACDLPFASGELLKRLSSFRDENYAAIVPLQPDFRPQPLCAFYRTEACLPIVEMMLRGDDWSMRNLLRRLETHFVQFDEISDLRGAEFFFLNVNTPEDYAQAQAALAKTL